VILYKGIVLYCTYKYEIKPDIKLIVDHKILNKYAIMIIEDKQF